MKFTLINEFGGISAYDDVVGEILGENLPTMYMEELNLRLLEDRTAHGTGRVLITDLFLAALIPIIMNDASKDPRLDMRITISEPGRFVRVLYTDLMFVHLQEIHELDAITDTRVEFVCRWEPSHVVSLNLP